MKGLHQLVNKKDYGGKKQVHELISWKIEHVWHLHQVKILFSHLTLINWISELSNVYQTYHILNLHKSWVENILKNAGVLIPQAWLMNESIFNIASCLPWCLLLPWASSFPWDDWDNIVHKVSYKNLNELSASSRRWAHQSERPHRRSLRSCQDRSRSGPAEGLEMRVLQM